MIRLYFIVEGQTEELFVSSYLGPYLEEKKILCYPTSIGGMSTFRKIDLFIRNLMHTKQRSSNACFTTMFDLYALPKGFPGYAEAKRQNDPLKKVACIEDAWFKKISDPRFIPYVQLHEFEALLFTDIKILETMFPTRLKEVEKLAKSTNSLSPEFINDRPRYSPSRRIITHIPEYVGRKVLAGPRLVSKIGIPTIRAKCKHFDEWVAKLENLT